MHTMVLGTTTYGKSFLMKSKIRQASKQGLKSLVLDPYNGTNWGASWQTDNWQQFLAVAKRNTGCLLVIDECGQVFGKNGSDQNLEMSWLASQASHNQHVSHFLATHYAMIPMAVRVNCIKGYVFHQSNKKACKLLAENFAGNDHLLEAYKLPKYHFYAVGYENIDSKQVQKLKL